MIEAGTSVGGYRVVRMIGRGGMGVVYEAVQTSLKRRVALKVLRPELADDPELRRALPAGGDGCRPRSSTRTCSTSTRSASRTRACSWRCGWSPARRCSTCCATASSTPSARSKLLDQVTGALDAAHEADLVHRDVKPQNVLVDEGDQAFLADFGLTRAGTETTVATSRPMLGSVAYVAPEIVRGEEPTPASDRYSFAATIFHCLTGDVVFPRGSDAAVLYAHATEPPPRASERRPELPEELDAGLRRRAREAARGPARRPRGRSSGRFATPSAPPSRGSARRRSSARSSVARRDSCCRRRSRERRGMGAGSRRGPRSLLAAAALGAAAALLLDRRRRGQRDAEVPLCRRCRRGPRPLGSDLATPERSVDCRGEAPTPGSPSCSIVQTELPGAEVLVPADGVIVGWTVRGAQRRPRARRDPPARQRHGPGGASQWEFAGNAGRTASRPRLPVEAGDQIGVELGPGRVDRRQRGRGRDHAALARARSAARTAAPTRARARASTTRWRCGPSSSRASASSVPSTSPAPPPRTLPTAGCATRASLTVDEPRQTRLDVELVEVDGRVVLDVSRARRGARCACSSRTWSPRGCRSSSRTFEYPGEPFGEADVWWVNPNTGRMIFHFFIVGEGKLEFAG